MINYLYCDLVYASKVYIEHCKYFYFINLFRFLLSLDEVIQSLSSQLEMWRTLVYVVAIGSYQIFKFIIELIEPESLRMPIESISLTSKSNEESISKAINFDITYSLMHYACASGSIPILEYLIKRPELNIFSNDNPTKESPLHWWVSNNQKSVLPTIVKEYISHDVDINVKDINGHTPLFKSIRVSD